MEIFLVSIFLLLGILTLLAVVILLRIRSGYRMEEMNGLLKARFLDFQSDIHRELNQTRGEMARSKDLISDQTIKTVENMKELGTMLSKLTQQQDEAQKLGQSLKDILQAPKLRGSYGEEVLEEMLERVLPRGVWDRQVCLEGMEQVDAVVRIKDVVIPIDAKFPRESYRRYLDASSTAERKASWKEYENAVKIQIKSVSAKYVKPEKGTSEFALMFIPSEAMYYETIAEKNHLGDPSTLYEYAQKHKVIPVSPNTFYAFLQTVILGIRNLEIIKGAKKLQEGLSALERSFDFFYRKHEDIGRNLRKASEAYETADTHIGRYRRQLENTLSLEDADVRAGSGAEAETETPGTSKYERSPLQKTT